MVEIVVTICIISIILGFAIPEILEARRTERETSAAANAKTLNDGIIRAKIKEDRNPIIVGQAADNVEDAAQYLLTERYIQ